MSMHSCRVKFKIEGETLFAKGMSRSYRAKPRFHRCCVNISIPDSKVHGTNMGPTWVLSATDGPHIGPTNLTIRVYWQATDIKWAVTPAVLLTSDKVINYVEPQTVSGQGSLTTNALGYVHKYKKLVERYYILCIQMDIYENGIYTRHYRLVFTNNGDIRPLLKSQMAWWLATWIMNW